ncbi:MAG: hypothetical protein L3K04_02830 [Thermoplasmata archaeon]|nr:hypothetical protein [Thermoplasmata archaeon]MCI4340768.1 hypothetical protein [Thermoplasmata archaeon]
MAADPLTTIPLRASTRAELAQLTTGGHSYDGLIRAILEELEARDPWFDEMDRRIEDWHAGRVKLRPIELLRAADPQSRKRGSRYWSCRSSATAGLRTTS